MCIEMGIGPLAFRSFTLTTFAYSDLSKRQTEFVRAICARFGGGSEFTRSELVDVCQDSGIYACPPSWITQDSRRVVSRGVYHLPEAAELWNSDSAPAPIDAGAAPAPVQGTVETVETASPSAQMVMGMTGGERATLIPQKIQTYVPWGHFSDVEKIIQAGMFYPMFVTGLSGNGKTTMIEQVCAKLKRECFRVNITKQTDEDDLIGGFRLINGETKFVYGPVVNAMKTGGVRLLDEIDLGSALIMCLQPVLEGKGVFIKKTGEWVAPAPGFTVVATANTKGKGSDDGRFIGTNVLNEAFLDRFPITLEQEYASRTIEKKILKKAMSAVNVDDADFADHLTKWAEIIRKSFAEGAVDEIISTRRLVDICKAYAIFEDKSKSIGFALARFDDDTREAFMNLYSKVDADVAEAAGEENIEKMKTAERIDLKGAGYDQKDDVKARGARFDSVEKVWYITGEQFANDQDFWNNYNPVVATSDDVCPF